MAKVKSAKRTENLFLVTAESEGEETPLLVLQSFHVMSDEDGNIFIKKPISLEEAEEVMKYFGVENTREAEQN